MAGEWQATAVMLHVDGDNDAATALYRQQAYQLLAEPRRSWLAKAVSALDKVGSSLWRLPD